MEGSAVLSCKPLIASRVKWKHPPSFDPSPFLVDPVALAAFKDPNILRAPSASWPKVPKAKVHASKPELIKLAAL